MDPSIVESRYFADEDRFNKLYKSTLGFLNSLHNSDEKADQSSSATLALDLQTFEMNVGKAAIVYETNMRERSEYDQILKETADQIEEHRREIEALKVQLQEERLNRRHKEEYEKLAHIINGYPARDVSEKRIESLTADIDALTREKSGMERESSLKAKQFYTLYAALDQLKSGADAMVGDILAAGANAAAGSAAGSAAGAAALTSPASNSAASQQSSRDSMIVE